MQVIRHGSFAGAARERNIDPSSVSRAVAALEAELGTKLFLRDTRKLVLTEAGVSFAEHLGVALEELVQARDAAVDAFGEVRGRLRVTASNAFAVHRLSPVLPAFCAAHPSLLVDLLLTESPVDIVAERVDVALRLVGTLKDSSLVAVPLHPIRYRVLASPKWVRAQQPPLREPLDLKSIPCLCFAHVGLRDPWQFTPIGGGDTVEFLVRPRLVATNALVLRESAIAGLGPVLLADWMCDADVASGALVDLFPDHVVKSANAPSTAWAVYPSRSYVPTKVRVFIDFLRGAFASGADAPPPRTRAG